MGYDLDLNQGDYDCLTLEQFKRERAKAAEKPKTAYTSAASYNHYGGQKLS